jgi:ubiquinone biosynthesis protein
VRLLKERYSPRAMMRRLKVASSSYIRVLEHLPEDIASIARKFRKNEVKFDFELRSIEELIETAEAATDNVAHALLISAIVVASAILVHAAPEGNWGFLGTIGLLGFIAASVLGFMLIVRSWRHRRASRVRVKRANKRRR